METEIPELTHHTVKPLLRDHCHERLPIFKNRTFWAEGPYVSV